MTATRDALLDRLAKLCAMEGSPNVHEAASARRRADDFCLKHGVSRDELAARDDAAHETVVAGSGFGAHWRFALVTAAARFMGVEAVRLLLGKRRFRVKLCGPRRKAERAARLYADLERASRTLARGAAKQPEARYYLDVSDLVLLTGREIADSFRRGFVAGVVEVMFAPPEEAAPVSAPAPPTDRGAGLGTVIKRLWSSLSGAKSSKDLVRAATPGPNPGPTSAPKYEDKRRSRVRLGEVASPGWYQLGKVLAKKHVRVGRDGVVAVRGCQVRDGRGGAR